MPWWLPNWCWTPGRARAIKPQVMLTVGANGPAIHAFQHAGLSCQRRGEFPKTAPCPICIHLPQPCLMRNCSTLDNRCSFYIKKFWYWNIPMSARHYLGHTIGIVTSSRQDESFQGFIRLQGDWTKALTLA